jgi:hypothetical protein
MEDLEKMRGEGKKKKGLNTLMKTIKGLRFQKVEEANQHTVAQLPPPTSTGPSPPMLLMPANMSMPLVTPGPSLLTATDVPVPLVAPSPLTPTLLTSTDPLELLGTPCPPLPTILVAPTKSSAKKRRAKPVDPRRKTKKVKF